MMCLLLAEATCTEINTTLEYHAKNDLSFRKRILR